MFYFKNDKDSNAIAKSIRLLGGTQVIKIGPMAALRHREPPIDKTKYFSLSLSLSLFRMEISP
jgi:hypothetical protein